MEIEDVVMKLVGPIDPVGESHMDRKRLDNLKVLCDVVGSLTARIEHVAEETDTHLASVKAAKRVACDFLLKRSTDGVALTSKASDGGSNSTQETPDCPNGSHDWDFENGLCRKCFAAVPGRHSCRCRAMPCRCGGAAPVIYVDDRGSLSLACPMSKSRLCLGHTLIEFEPLLA